MCGERCGTERWAVKTLSDADASRVNLTPQPATVAWLVAQPLPAHLPEDGRIPGIETQTFAVRARILRFKLETDRDVHIVLADLENPEVTMIAEIPSSECSGACSSAHVRDFQTALEALASHFGEPIERFERLPRETIATVTGVGFFDFQHGQSGLAPNGIELHPVLRIQTE